MSAASPSNIWAVGDYSNGSSVPQKQHSLILHWNGVRWSRQSAPSPPTSSSWPRCAVSGSEAWAVGDFGRNKSVRVLILHFTGGKWSQAKIPAVGNAQLRGVAASSATNQWAVGFTGALTSSREKSYALHCC